jgi:flagellar hook-basal body complex protein FliE
LGGGAEVRDTSKTSSNNFGGAISATLRLMKRSMTKAKAKMEQAIRGQIGHPAACMMDNKRISKLIKSLFIIVHAFLKAYLIWRCCQQ